MKKLMMLTAASFFAVSVLAQSNDNANTTTPAIPATPSDIKAGSHPGAMKNNKSEIKKDRAEIKKDKAELQQDKQELMKDKVNRNKEEIKEDKAVIKNEKAELRDDKAKIKKDKAHKNHHGKGNNGHHEHKAK